MIRLCLKKFDRIEDSLRTQEKIYDKLDRNFEELRRDKEEDEKNKEKNAKILETSRCGF